MSAEDFTEAMEGKREFRRLTTSKRRPEAATTVIPFLLIHLAQAWM